MTWSIYFVIYPNTPYISEEKPNLAYMSLHDITIFWLLGKHRKLCITKFREILDFLVRKISPLSGVETPKLLTLRIHLKVQSCKLEKH